jgi:dUTP pyrophosphatase
MIERLKNLNTLKNVQAKLSGLDDESTESMFKSIGVNVDELEGLFLDTSSSKIPLKYVNETDNNDPNYEYDSDSGFDLRSTDEIWVHPNDRKLVPTGLRVDIPEGYEIQVRSKSGLALKQGLMVLNSPGTVDSGYQGEIKVIIFNTSTSKIKIDKGQKIAQAVLCPVVNGKWVNLIKVEEIGEKDRNDKGFGSTGL